VSKILGAGQLEQSWDETKEARDTCPAHLKRSKDIIDLSIAGLRITGASACLSIRERRAIQLGGLSTPLKKDPTGLLSSTFSGSSGRVDYSRRLEMNTQDSDEDVLLRQDRSFPKRGTGGSASSGQADGGDLRASLPVQRSEELSTLCWPSQVRSMDRAWRGGVLRKAAGAAPGMSAPMQREKSLSHQRANSVNG
jgi:hypothetical protein